MIHDEELRQLFQAECEEHLQKLESGLLHLEHQPNDDAMLVELQRVLHNLKGSARMLGVADVESLSHCMEDVLKAISRGETVLTAELVDHLELALDALHKLENEALTGVPAQVCVPEILALLIAKPTADKIQATELSPTVPISIPSLSPAKIEMSTITSDTRPLPEAATSESITAESYQIETIRVDPKKLDVLMTHAGELAVIKSHVERWLERIDNLIVAWEETARIIKAEFDVDYSNSYVERVEQALYPLHRVAFENATELGRIAQGLEEDIRALRLLPLNRVLQLFPRTVRDIARTLSKDVQLIIHGGDTTADKHLLEMLKDPLMHLVRNAIYHGIELPTERMANGKSAQAKLTLSAKRTAAHVIIEVIDDGRGLNIEAVKKTAMEQGWNTAEEISSMSEQQLQALIFVSGFSTSQIIDDISGRGVGLDVVKNNVERLKGTLTVKSTFNQGCTFTIKLPLTLTTTHIFLIAIAKQRYAIPVEFVRMARYVSASEVFLVQDQETINWHGEAVSMAWLEDLLELSKGKRIDKKDNVSHKQPCLILETKAALLGVFVDEIVEEREIVLKPTGPLLDRVRNVSGITILDSGEVCVVLNPIDLVRTAQKKASSGAISWRVAEQLPDTKQQRKQTKPVILLAEDSITTRTQEKRILESAGYEVITAVDGLMAFNTLSTRSFDAVVSDVEMPNMDGLTLASKIREIKEYEHLPIVLVTSLATEADRKRGMDVGADAYIVKSAFNQQVLLDTLGRLV